MAVFFFGCISKRPAVRLQNHKKWIPHQILRLQGFFQSQSQIFLFRLEIMPLADHLHATVKSINLFIFVYILAFLIHKIFQLTIQIFFISYFLIYFFIFYLIIFFRQWLWLVASRHLEKLMTRNVEIGLALGLKWFGSLTQMRSDPGPNSDRALSQMRYAFIVCEYVILLTATFGATCEWISKSYRDSSKFWQAYALTGLCMEIALLICFTQS